MKTIEQVLKEQLGALMFEVAVLTSRNSALEEQVKKQESPAIPAEDHSDGK